MQPSYRVVLTRSEIEALIAFLETDDNPSLDILSALQALKGALK